MSKRMANLFLYACMLLLYCKALLILLMTFHSNSTYFTHGLSIIFICVLLVTLYINHLYMERAI